MDHRIIRRSILISVNHAIPVHFLKRLGELGFTTPPHECIGLPFNLCIDYDYEISSICAFAYHILKSYLDSEPSEAKLRVLVWDSIITQFIVDPPGQEDLFRLEPEWPAKDCLKLIDDKIVDYAILSKYFKLPIIMIEIGKDSIIAEGYPKDFSKLIGMMAVSCRLLCIKLQKSKADLKLARIFGLWISGLSLRMCTAHPIVEFVNGFLEISIAISFDPHWEIGLLNDSSSSPCSESCCNGKNCVATVIINDNKSDDASSSSIHEKDEEENRHEPGNVHVRNSDSLVVTSEGTLEDFDESIIDTTTSTKIFAEYYPIEIPEDVQDEENEDFIEESTPSLIANLKSLNSTSLSKLKVFFECAKEAEKKMILSLNTCPNQPPPRYTDDHPIIVESLRSNSEYTPDPKRVKAFLTDSDSKNKGSNSSNNNKNKNNNKNNTASNILCSLGDSAVYTDHFGRDHYKVCKRQSSESEIYKLFSNNPVFPHLYSCSSQVPDSKTVVFDFEKLEDFNFVPAPTSLKFIKQQSLAQALVDAVTCSVHIFCGLWYMHDFYGLVHSDISASNIMFSPQIQAWKLIDFERSMKIEDSLKYSRISGTPDYIAPESIESGIFTTKSDIFSLGCFIWAHLIFPLNCQAEMEGIFDEYKNEKEMKLARLCDTFEDFNRSLLEPNPANRLSAFDALSQLYSILVDSMKEFPECSVVGKYFMISIAENILNNKITKSEDDSQTNNNNNIAEIPFTLIRI